MLHRAKIPQQPLCADTKCSKIAAAAAKEFEERQEKAIEQAAKKV
jgi:hypothetical protein